MAHYVALTEADGTQIWVNLDQVMWMRRPGEATETTLWFGKDQDVIWVKERPGDGLFRLPSN